MGFDYSQSASYFVTLVTYQRAMLFGEIICGEVQLNAMGKIIESAWNAIGNRFPGVELNEFVIMPNHFHAIITVRATLVVAPDPAATDVRAGTSPAPTRDLDFAATDIRAGTSPAPIGDLDSAAMDVRAGTSPAPTRDLDSAAITGTRTGTSPAPTRDLDSAVGTDTRAGTSPAPTAITGAGERTKPDYTVGLGDVIGAFKSITTHDIILAVRCREVEPFSMKVWQRNYYEHIIRNDAEMEQTLRYVIENPACWAEDAENPAFNTFQIRS
jgi:putative transposase